MDTFEEGFGDTYLTLICTDKNKEVLTKYTKCLDKVKNSIEKVNNKLGEYREDFIKIKFNSDDSLSLNETLKLQNMTLI